MIPSSSQASEHLIGVFQLNGTLILTVLRLIYISRKLFKPLQESQNTNQWDLAEDVYEVLKVCSFFYNRFILILLFSSLKMLLFCFLKLKFLWLWTYFQCYIMYVTAWLLLLLTSHKMKRTRMMRMMITTQIHFEKHLLLFELQHMLVSS